MPGVTPGTVHLGVWTQGQVCDQGKPSFILGFAPFSILGGLKLYPGGTLSSVLVGDTQLHPVGHLALYTIILSPVPHALSSSVLPLTCLCHGSDPGSRLELLKAKSVLVPGLGGLRVQ